MISASLGILLSRFLMLPAGPLIVLSGIIVFLGTATAFKLKHGRTSHIA
jgi:ABC-type Mn2+/Zn2+ transport system permease subunit